jgi:hypothetical protein
MRRTQAMSGLAPSVRMSAMSCWSLGHHRKTSAHGTVAMALSHSRCPSTYRGMTPGLKRPSVGHLPSRFSSANTRRQLPWWTSTQSGKPALDFRENLVW